jgi:hypothetical protein
MYKRGSSVSTTLRRHDGTLLDHKDVAAIRERASKLLESDEPSDLTSAANLLKTAVDIEAQHATVSKLHAEKKKVLKDLSEARNHFKDTLAAATPLISSIILAGTLIFQIWQSAKTDQEKREDVERQAKAAEQTRFTDALKTVQTDVGISPASTLLNTFTQEPQKSAARQMELKLMISAANLNDFKDMFSATFEPISPDDAPAILQLNRSIRTRQKANIPQPSVNTESKLSPTYAKAEEIYSLTEDELRSISPAIDSIIRLASSEGKNLDLTEMSLDNADLTGVNLHNDNLTSTTFSVVDLNQCDLSHVTQFQRSSFIGSPWWQASHINPDLLHYLEEEYPYSRTIAYPDDSHVSEEDYKKNIARLESENRHQ